MDMPFITKRGVPLPLGSNIMKHGVNFSIYSKHATEVSLVLFEDTKQIAEFRLDAHTNKTGDIWHIFVKSLKAGVEYGYRIDMEDNPDRKIHRFNKNKILIDPYAKLIKDVDRWGDFAQDDSGKIVVKDRYSVVYKDDFDWEGDSQLNNPIEETIIYEMHVRGFTQDESSNVKNRGTFLGVIEKIPYLKELGISAVELLPVNEFEEADADRINPKTGERLVNYWGYNSINFFAPCSSYAKFSDRNSQVLEFKQMVKELHKAGIEVILDVVFNHTAEGNENGHTFSFRGIDNKTYYMLGKNGEYLNFPGCGNTLNCNHPVVRDMIIDSLRYWVIEMHVDGFRFDLASILGRGVNGEVLANPPLLENIAFDPVLANTKLIAEAWDAAGLYQVGSFPAWGRWAEWNGKFRDDIRKFIKGDKGITKDAINRIMGSPDLYEVSGRNAFHSINFITSHDGFTLNDLVSYNEKHNIENGENNQDGDNNNNSWNCGVEGESGDENISALRKKQMKNFATLMLLSSGVPMISAGDEFSRTQEGNNNAYCQDNKISWIDWSLMNKNWEIFRFFKLLIGFRKNHPLIHLSDYPQKDKTKLQIIYHGIELNKPDLSPESRSFAIEFRLYEDTDYTQIKKDIYFVANMYWKDLEFELPHLDEEKSWYKIIDTSKPSPFDIVESPIKIDSLSRILVLNRSISAFISH